MYIVSLEDNVNICLLIYHIFIVIHTICCIHISLSKTQSSTLKCRYDRVRDSVVHDRWSLRHRSPSSARDRAF